MPLALDDHAVIKVLNVVRNSGEDGYEQRHDREEEAAHEQVRVVQTEEVHEDDGADHQEHAVYCANPEDPRPGEEAPSANGQMLARPGVRSVDPEPRRRARR